MLKILMKVSLYYSLSILRRCQLLASIYWVYEIKYKTANEPLEEREIMWVEAIDKLLEDESLKKTTQKKLSKKLGLLGLKKLFKNGRRS